MTAPVPGTPAPKAFKFEWRVPKVVIYRAGAPAPGEVVRRWHLGLNRYPGVVIGVAGRCGSWVFSLVWGRPGGAR